MRYTKLNDDDMQMTLLGQKQNNGDFDWYPVIDVKYAKEWDSSFPETYIVTAKAVSPSEAGQTNIDSALSCCGVAEDEPSLNDVIEALADYGTFATIKEECGNNLRKLLKQAKKEVDIYCMITGFVFDRLQNRIGADGWDALKGNMCKPSCWDDAELDA